MHRSYLLEGKEHILADTICTFSYFVVSENIHHIGPMEAIIRNSKKAEKGESYQRKIPEMRWLPAGRWGGASTQ